MEKDYSLLRPFDLEAAKRGEAICWINNEQHQEYVAGPDSAGDIVFIAKGGYGEFGFRQESHFRMAPLAWVRVSADDPTLRPVYKGDVLWYSAHGFSITVTGLNPYHPDNGLRGDVLNAPRANPRCYKGGEDTWAPFSVWSWTPPKAKREVTLLAYLNDVSLVWVREGMPFAASSVRVPSEDKVIVLEE